MVDVVLHVGAHRTGTTSLQSALDLMSTELASSGVVVLTPPRPGKRGHSESIRDIARVASKAHKKGFRRWFKAHAAKRQLQRLTSNALPNRVPLRRLILSDEVMLGVAFSRNGIAIYPDAFRNLKSLRTLLPATPSEIHLCVRSYDSFLTSVYAMRALYVPQVQPFTNLKERFLCLDYGWINLVETIVELFPKTKLVVSVFEEHNLLVKLKSLTRMSGESLNRQMFTFHVNRAPTVEAIEHKLHNRHETRHPDEIVQLHLDGTRFDPFSDKEKAYLQRCYSRDLEQLYQRQTVSWLVQEHQ